MQLSHIILNNLIKRKQITRKVYRSIYCYKKMASITTETNSQQLEEEEEEENTTTTATTIDSTKPLYLEDTYLFEKKDVKFIEVRMVGEDESKLETVVITESTIFHPQGGGQPSDTGIMKQGDSVEFKVSKVSKAGLFENNLIYHFGEFTSETKTFDVEKPIYQMD